MSDVTWITIERAEELFFASKAELDDLIERGDLDHKIEDHDGRKLKLLMLHQLARHFDGRDTRARMTPDDIKDIIKGTASNILYVAAGAALVSTKNLLSNEEQSSGIVDVVRDKIKHEHPNFDAELDNILSSVYDGHERWRTKPEAKFALQKADALRARVGVSISQFSEIANLDGRLSRKFFEEHPLNWPSFDRCIRILTAMCVLKRFRIEVFSWRANDDKNPLLLALINVTLTPEPLPGGAPNVIVEEMELLLLQLH